MADFFPRHTVEWRIEELPLLRRIALSLGAIAVLTGVLVRLYRWMLLASHAMPVWLFLIGIGGGLVLLLGLTAAYLGNHPVHQWVWRAPLFALVEIATEVAASALLIAAGVERIGTARAHWSDWPTLALRALTARAALILTFTLVLAGVVQVMRRALLKHERRDSTAIAIHEARREEETGGRRH
jgi:hypothetical protein